MNLRDATPADVDFLAWVMLAASRSHLDRSIWEYVNDHTEEQTLDYLARVADTDTVHLFHHSLFLIAEVDGEPAAGMCAYDSARRASRRSAARWQASPSRPACVSTIPNTSGAAR